MDVIRSRVIPLVMDNIDTDMIIPAEYLKRTDKAGIGKGLFAHLRESDPSTPFARKVYSGATILAAGENFGCGSSREHAVWALLDWGIKAVIAVSFADIFRQNALKNGLLPIRLRRDLIDRIVAAGDVEIEISLARRSVNFNDRDNTFAIDAFHHELLLKDIDDLDYLLSKQYLIDAYHRERSKPLYIEVDEL